MARVIVVDDEAGICKYIAKQLQDDGHEVRIALAGDEAIDLGHLFRPEVLIADWRLGSEYDGLDVAEAVQHVNAQLRTILITAYPSTTLSERASALRVHALLIKPVSLEEISRQVRNAFDPRPWALDVSDN